MATKTGNKKKKTDRKKRNQNAFCFHAEDPRAHESLTLLLLFYFCTTVKLFGDEPEPNSATDNETWKRPRRSECYMW